MVSLEYEEGGWNPGIFCGFLIEGEDHGMKDLMPNEPLAVLIMDIDKPLHAVMKTSAYYKTLVNEVTLPMGWYLSDQTTENQNVNPWHPLVFYRNLSDFISNAVTLEQQSETFFKQMGELQQVLLSCDSFVTFCKEMHLLYEERVCSQKNN